METITLTDGTSVELETRACSGGCGKVFRCLPSSPQTTARSLCKELCGRQPLSKALRKKVFTDPASYVIPSRATDKQKQNGSFISRLEKKTAKEVAELKKGRSMQTNSRIKMGLEGNYFYIGHRQDAVLYLEGDKAFGLVRFFLTSEEKFRTKEEVDKRFPEGYGKLMTRASGLFSRNFGGKWFIPEDGGFHLCGLRNYQTSIKESYVAPKEGKMRQWRRIHVPLKKMAAAKMVKRVRALTAEGLTAREISVIIGKSPSYVAVIRTQHKIKSLVPRGRPRKIS